MLEYTHWQMRNIRELKELAPDPSAELHPTTAKNKKTCVKEIC